MDLRALRISGIVVSGVLIGGAALFAMSARPPTPSPVLRPPAERHHSDARPAAFAISLRGGGPLARAQRLAMRGGHDSAARRQVERALARQRAFRGLCFERFLPRGDVVLRVCREGTSNVDWQTRLRAMPAVANVDGVQQTTQDGRGE